MMLLALATTLSMAIVLLSHAAPKRSVPWLVFGIGYMFLAASLVAELVLAYEFQDWAVRGFYWARIMLAVAWLGQGTLLLNLPRNKYLNYATWGLIAASLVSLGMITFTPITRAEDWFSPSQPIYWQLGEVLATNRPTRWGGLLLNFFGVAALICGAIYAYLVGNKKEWRTAARPALIVLGGLLLIIPIYWPPTEMTVIFLYSTVFAPILLFLGVSEVLYMDKGTRKPGNKMDRQ